MVVTRRATFRVTTEEEGQRLDRLLCKHDPGLTRRTAANLCRQGRVLVNGRPAVKGELAKSGQQISHESLVLQCATATPNEALHVVLERRDLVVVDKPAGQPTAPLDDQERGTLANALVGRYPEMSGFGYGPLEPGLIHRLDTHTSGLVLAARHEEAFRRLRAALQSGALHKRYLAVLSAGPLDDRGEINLPIRPHPRRARRVVTCAWGAPGARPARTRWRVLTRGQELTLVEIEVSRAVRHQIRVHFSALGLPLVGDSMYGGQPHPALGPGHALHASYIAWVGDEVVPSFHAETGLPERFATLLGRGGGTFG